MVRVLPNPRGCEVDRREASVERQGETKRQPKLPFARSLPVMPSRRLRGGFRGVALPEFLDAPGSVDDLLLASIERMARRADFDVQRLVHGRAGGERVATAASDLNLAVLRVNTGFHCQSCGVRRPLAGRGPLKRRIMRLFALQRNVCQKPLTRK